MRETLGNAKTAKAPIKSNKMPRRERVPRSSLPVKGPI